VSGFTPQGLGTERDCDEAQIMTTKRLLMTLTIALTTLLCVATASASAWTYSARSGSPGAVVAAPAAAFQDVNYQYAWGTSTRPLVTADTATVRRSPATRGAQDVLVRYALEGWDGSRWVEVMASTSHVRMYAQHTQARFGNLVLYPRALLGSYRVTQSFHWFVAGTSRKIGFSQIVPGANDALCNIPRCSQYSGYVTMNRYGTYRSASAQPPAAAEPTDEPISVPRVRNPRAH
jgi:hypothetical protein